MGAAPGPTPQQYAAAMELAKIAYTDESDPGAQRSDIGGKLQALPAWESRPWKLVWGPATNQGILAYVARLESLPGAALTYALAFRGTLTELAAHDVLRNVFEDLDAFHQVPFDYPASAGAHVSSGGNLAFGSVQGLVDPVTQQTLLSYIRDLAASTVTLIVAGHSLGGALVQMASLWLRSELGTLAEHVTFLPCTFAAPTFGNQQFATLYDATFPNAFRAVNTLDVVPMAYENVDGVQRSYPPPGQTLTEFDPVLNAAAQIAKDSTGNVYRSVGGTLYAFTGWMPQSAAGWAQIAGTNHASDTYLDFVRKHAYDAIHGTS